MRAVFLDRDGVINEEVDLLRSPEQVRLLPGAAGAIRRLNESGLLTILITNQAVVARGWCTEAGIGLIHDRLQALLSAEGAKLDAIYFCPYHENADLLEYRRDSPERKPGTGMLERAAREFALNLRECFLVGDTTSDILAGRRCGCRTILVETGYAGRDGKYEASPDLIAAGLPEAVDLILNEGDPAA